MSCSVWLDRLALELSTVPVMENAPADQRSMAPGLNVFVHLAENKDAEQWRRRWLNQTLVGVNDETPYGYGRAEKLGCRVTFSRAFPEGRSAKFLRYGLRLLLGFDFLHAWRQREALQRADVIWTHTESQYLAVAAVLLITGYETKLIGQSVWLFDHWDRLSWMRQRLYVSLINRVDVLTFLSPANMCLAKARFPDFDVRFVPFGIPAEDKLTPRIRAEEPFRILAIGSDRHRDWKTLIDVVKSRPDMSLTILSGTVPRRLVAGVPNIEVRLARKSDELGDAFERANLVCVPLKENQHASGITVIQEAALFGVPVIASDTGGLRDYFADDEIRYVPSGDPAALLAALLEMREHPQEAYQMAVRAQARMGKSGLGAEVYIKDHVRISHELMWAGRRHRARNSLKMISSNA